MRNDFKKLWTSLVTGLLLLSLTACTTLSPKAEPAPTAQHPVPEQWLQPEPIPELRGRLNADLARAYEEAKAAIKRGNADKAAIKEWSDGTQRLP